MEFGSFRKMQRIAYCTAFVVAGLSSPGQDLWWVPDRDDSNANDVLEKDTVNVFLRFLTIFCPHPLGKTYHGTTELTAPDMLEEDLAAIPDLMSGGAAEVYTAIRRQYGEIPYVYTALPRLGRRAQNFLNWYGEFGPLRYVCTFQHDLDGPIRDPATISLGHRSTMSLPR